MSTFKFSILIALFLFHVEIGQAQSKQKLANGAIISGQIEGSKNETVELYFFSEANILMESEILVTKTDNRGLFHFSIPATRIKNGSRMALRSGKAIGNESIAYILEAGDDIHVSAKKTKKGIEDVHFSGKGSAKYECMAKIYSALDQLDFVEKENKKPDFYTAENVEQLCKKCDSLMPFQVLDTYQKRISPMAYQIMKADIIGNVRYLCLVELVRLSTGGINDTEKNKAAELQNQLFKASQDTISGNVLVLSNKYMNLLFAKTSFEIAYAKGANYSMKDLYVKLRTDYQGVLREHLLVATLLQGNRLGKAISGDGVDSLRRDAYALIQTPSLKQYVEKGLVKSKGTEALDFSLSNSKGGIVNLHDLKGKVVVIDVWFTGCPGCLSYSERLEWYVYKEFKDNPDVVFVSISGDRRKDQWLKSVKAGKYTREENINLYTNGMSFDHPWMKYYGFNGGPYSLIIDKNGKIFSGNPPTNDMGLLISNIKEAEVQQ